MSMLSGEVALVTGASRGIGRGVALELGRLGAHVVGAARTARAERVMIAAKDPQPGFPVTEEDLAASDTPEFTGRAIAHLACDPDLLSRSGKTYPVVQLSHLYGFPDVDGVQPDLDDYTALWVRRLSAIDDILSS